MSDKVDLKLDWCSYTAAKYAVEHWHYSKSMPTPPVLHIGVWEDGKFVGVILFSRGANKNLGSFVRLSELQVCELTRVALDKHISTVSKILSIAIKMVRIKEKGLILIVSFADTNHNHNGTIYQAGNWIYSGETSPSYLYRDKFNRVWHQRQVSVSGIKPQYGTMRIVPKISECEKIPQLGKHRYLFSLDDAMRKQIEPLRKPYPKKLCGTGETDNAAESNPQIGGASPTVPLLINTVKEQ
jgi:hypothetical protein